MECWHSHRWDHQFDCAYRLKDFSQNIDVSVNLNTPPQPPLQLSFMGLRALHFYSMGMFPVILILYFVIVGLTADKLYLAKEVSKEIVVSSGQILSL